MQIPAQRAQTVACGFLFFPGGACHPPKDVLGCSNKVPACLVAFTEQEFISMVVRNKKSNIKYGTGQLWLELEVVVRDLMWVLGTKPGSTAGALNS